MQFRDLNEQYRVLKEKIDNGIQKVVSDCNFISGQQVNALEEELAKYVTLCDMCKWDRCPYACNDGMGSWSWRCGFCS